MPGDVIACGTSIGVGAMRAADNAIDVSIEGVGTLSNRFRQDVPFRYSQKPPDKMRVCVIGAGAMGAVAFSAWFFRFSWNAFMPVVFGAAELTFLQALGGLSLLAGLVLFLRLLRGGN